VARLLLALLLFASSAYADPVHLAWDANPANENVAGYKLYLGAAPYQWAGSVDVGNVTDYIFTNVQSSTYFAATAYNEYGESDFSNVVHYVFVVDPATGLSVLVRCVDTIPDYLKKEDNDYLLKEDNDKVIK
jgi:hypothetical protein